MADSAVELVSVSTAGNFGFDDSRNPSLSADGRFAAFVSTDSSLGAAPGNSSGFQSIYVRDRVTGITERISDQTPASSATSAIGADNDSFSPSISGDGRFVVFSSFATNLVPEGSNNTAQILLYDRTTRRTSLVSATPDGKAAGGASSLPSISGDGRFVSFLSTADDLIAADTNGTQDVFVRDLAARKTSRVSVKTGNVESTTAAASGSTPRMSFDGRFVVFSSSAPDLVAVDANGASSDVFIHDRQMGTTTLVSVVSNSANLKAFQPDISADGRFVSFSAFTSGFTDSDQAGLDGNGTSYLFERQTSLTAFSRPNSSTPRLSADGRFVAFVERSTGSNSEVKIYDRQLLRSIFAAPRLNPTGNTQTAPSLSADGRAIAFESGQSLTSSDNNGVRDIFATPLFDTIAIEKAAFYLSETAGSLAIRVRRSGVSLGAISVNYGISAAGDTAAPSVDYNFPGGVSSGTLSWANGDAAPKILTIPILNRPLSADGYRAFTVAISSPSNSARLGIAKSSVVLRDPASHPLEDEQGHALTISRLIAAGTSWREKLFRGQFTIHNPGELPSFPGEIDYVYQPLDTITRQPDGAPVILSTVSVDTVPAAGDLTFFSQADVSSQSNGAQLDGDLFVKLYELKPGGSRVLQATAFASNYDTTEGVAPPAGGVTMPDSGRNAPGFTLVKVASVTINPPAQILENSNASFTATVKLSDGSTLANVTPAWKTNLFTISPAGVLKAAEVTADTAITISASVRRDGITTTGTQNVKVKNVPAKPLITSADSAFASLNKPFSYRIIAVHEADTFDAVGLPDGLAINAGTGIVSGTPTVAGTFAIELRATNEIDTGTKAFSLIVSTPSPLTVALGGTGTGSVSGIGASKDSFPRVESRDTGRTYTLVAKPARGSLFEGWHNGITSINPKLTFVMTPNLALEARFVTNPFTLRLGTYLGLIRSSPATQGSTGSFQFAVTSTGAFSGKFILEGRTFPLKGLFAAGGTFNGTIARTGQSPLALTLQLDLSAGSEAVGGTLSDGIILSVISGQRALANASAFAGRYTVLLPPTSDSPELPQGAGFGTLVVSAKGAVKFGGVLGDGTPVSIGGKLIHGGSWPIYLSLYSGGGSLSGNAAFATLAQSDLTAALSWFKPERPADLFYPAGWPSGLALNLRGSKYEGLAASDSLLIAHGGALLGDQSQSYSVSSTGKVTLSAPILPKFTLKFARPSGLFSGTFADPFTGLQRSFSGAVLEKSAEAQGLFKGGEKQTGIVGTNSVP